MIIWCGVIFFVSGLSQLGVVRSLWDFILRKIAHAGEYFILTLLLYRAVKGSFSLNTRFLRILPFMLSFLYAVSDELHQFFVPKRNCSITDIAIDTLGILIFYALIKFSKKFNEKAVLWI